MKLKDLFPYIDDHNPVSVVDLNKNNLIRWDGKNAIMDVEDGLAKYWNTNVYKILSKDNGIIIQLSV